MSSLSIFKVTYVSREQYKKITDRREDAEYWQHEGDSRPYKNFRAWMRRHYGYADFIATDGTDNGYNYKCLNLGKWVDA